MASGFNPVCQGGNSIGKDINSRRCKIYENDADEYSNKSKP